MHSPNHLKSSFILIGLLFTMTNLLAQDFNIGHTSTSFYDAERDRNISTEIYYPAENAGEDVSAAEGNFPVLIFGHGFLMSWDSYENFWTELVPEGYVICFPNTEMSLLPSHGDFGLDLRFLSNQMQEENELESSLFFNILRPETALMGHSMGGGASFLAAENNSNITALVNFAAAETNPSAIAAAANITVPALLFSGEDDCVTPPNEHQNLMYENLASSCKTQISINQGIHCYFANDNFSCTLGESFCNPFPSINRDLQQSITFTFLKIWLDAVLRNNESAFQLFNEGLDSSVQVTFSQDCSTTSIKEWSVEQEIKLFPNPSSNQLNIKLPEDCSEGNLIIYNSLAEKILERPMNQSSLILDISHLPEGSYFIEFHANSVKYSSRFLKAD